MSRPRASIGKIGESNKIDLTPASMDSVIKREDQLRRNEKINVVFVRLGIGLRKFVNTVFPGETPPTDSPEINRRAGKTALATAISLAVLVGGAAAHEANTYDVKCDQFTMEDFGTEPGPAASALAELYSATPSNQTYDSAFEAFEQNGTVEVCDPYLELINKN